MNHRSKHPAPRTNAGSRAWTRTQIISSVPRTVPIARSPIPWDLLAWRLHDDAVTRSSSGDLLERHAQELGVRVSALHDLGVGLVVDDAALRQCVEYALDPAAGRGPRWRQRAAQFGLAAGIWTYPMRLEGEAVVGLRLRRPDGRKLAVRTSLQGVFAPAESRGVDYLLVTEGASDAAAGLSLGFDVVGRASANPGTVADAAALQRCRDRDVVIVPDRDPVGIAGAFAFTNSALRVARSVRWLLPPNGTKDLRGALVGGLSRVGLLYLIEVTPPIRPRIEVRR